ncbi:MAG: hypothetical protein JXR21_00785 [Candidatus Marinimicrobia bacterium]|nr:hypothetical protein [Candidatus Neomarinimicrobiota bacterium]
MSIRSGKALKGKEGRRPRLPKAAICLLVVAGMTSCLSAGNWSAGLALMTYRSFSQQSTGLPMNAGYPLISSRSVIPSVRYGITGESIRHTFDISFMTRSALSASEYLLNSDDSYLFRSGFDYRLSMPLSGRNAIRFRHGFIGGFGIEDRVLTYHSGAKERTRDLNVYLGPGIEGAWTIGPRWALRMHFDARFYLPYLNAGYLEDVNPAGVTFFESNYRAFYYQTLAGLELSYRFRDGDVLHLGAARDDIVGFANREPLFYAKDVIHFKLERNVHIYLRYDLNSLKPQTRPT